MKFFQKEMKSKKYKDAYLLVDYDTDSGSNVQLLYHIGNDDGEYVREISTEELPIGKKVYRVSSKDNIILFTKQKAKESNKKKTYLKAAGGKPAIVRGLRSNEVYLTNKRIAYLDETKNNRIAPLNILVDKYLKENNKFGRTGHQTVVSLLIRGEDNIIVLSWLKSQIGEYVKDAHSVLMLDNLNDEEEFQSNIFDSFRSPASITLDINDESIDHVILTEIELLPYVTTNKGDLYPVDEEFLKLPKSFVAGVSIVVTASVAGTTFFMNETLTKKETSLIREERQLRNSKPNVDEFRKNKIRNHVSFFIENRNVDFERAFEASEKLWIPNSRIDLIVNKEQTVVRLFSVNSSSYIPHIFTDIIHMQQAPEGFVKGEIIPSNNYESFEVTYTRQGR